MTVSRSAGLFARLFGRLYAAVMNLPEGPMRWAQGHLPDGRLGWLFVGPNLAIFAIFTFLPIVIDFYYAGTGGTNLLPTDRPWVGTENFSSLLACRDYFDPNTCVRDQFWYAIWNTSKFVVLQVGLMLIFSLTTPLMLQPAAGPAMSSMPASAGLGMKRANGASDTTTSATATDAKMPEARVTAPAW